MKTIFVDLGGTLILNEEGNAVANQKLIDLLKNFRDEISIIAISDTILDVDDVLTTFGIKDALNPFVITRAKDGVQKDTSETYKNICKELSLDPKNCLLVDDQASFREAAKEAGVSAISPKDENLEQVLKYFIEGSLV